MYVFSSLFIYCHIRVVAVDAQQNKQQQQRRFKINKENKCKKLIQLFIIHCFLSILQRQNKRSYFLHIFKITCSAL